MSGFSIRAVVASIRLLLGPTSLQVLSTAETCFLSIIYVIATRLPALYSIHSGNEQRRNSPLQISTRTFEPVPTRRLDDWLNEHSRTQQFAASEVTQFTNHDCGHGLSTFRCV